MRINKSWIPTKSWIQLLIEIDRQDDHARFNGMRTEVRKFWFLRFSTSPILLPAGVRGRQLRENVLYLFLRRHGYSRSITWRRNSANFDARSSIESGCSACSVAVPCFWDSLLCVRGLDILLDFGKPLSALELEMLEILWFGDDGRSSSTGYWGLG